MRIVLLLVGKTDSRLFAEAIRDYSERIQHFIPFSIEVIPDVRNASSLSQDQQKQKEGALILKALQPGDAVVLLDEHGKELRSVELAEWMAQKVQRVPRRLVFVIGGPYGFSPEVYAVAQEQLSLSRMTFSHQMVRLIFVEQVYRAFSIIHHSPYHHE